MILDLIERNEYNFMCAVTSVTRGKFRLSNIFISISNNVWLRISDYCQPFSSDISVRELLLDSKVDVSKRAQGYNSVRELSLLDSRVAYKHMVIIVFESCRTRQQSGVRAQGDRS